jgi:uncharacterized protein
MNVFIKKILLGLTFLSISLAPKADFTTAMANYNVKQFPEAMEEFKRLALLGHKDSQFNIGVMHFRGEGVAENPVEAYAWLALASADGDAERSHMRDILMKKLDTSQKQQALERTDVLLKQLGDEALKEKLTPVLLSDADCQFQLTMSKLVQPLYPMDMIKRGLGGSVDLDFTVDTLGFVRDYSVIVSTNKSFEQPSLDAIKKWRYEPIIIDGKPVEVSVKQIRVRFRVEGAEWDQLKIKKYVTELREKASTGTPNDMYVFAYITDMLSELKVQRKEANFWLLKAAQAGLASAQYEMGKSLVRGEGCKQDVQKGVQWLTLAAQDNSPDAQYFLGVSLLGSDKFQQNKQQAIEWLNHAAASGHPRAMMRLAWILATDHEEHIRDAAKSLTLVNKIYAFYPDKFRANETLAAAQAVNGLFDEAIKSQKEAIKFAKQIDYPLDALQLRLVAYQQQQAWRE